MKVYMFKPRFEAPILAGIKRHTVRPRRKRPTRPGDTLSLRVWEGLPYRSKQREFLRTQCWMVCESFEITAEGYFRLGGSYISEGFSEIFAMNDGFKDKAEMLEWFKAEHGLPFKSGEVVYWLPPNA